MDLRGLPYVDWQVNAGWVVAANIAADLAACTRLLGHCDDADLAGAHLGRPGTTARPAPPAKPTPPPKPGTSTISNQASRTLND